MKRTLALLFAAVMAACSSSYDAEIPDVGDVPEPTSCATISGGDTKVAVDQTACPGCESSDAGLAADGDKSTAGSLASPVAMAGFAGLRVTAQDGVVFAAGSQAGAIATFSRHNNVESGSIVLRTYLQDELQEESTVSTSGVNVNTASSGQARHYSFKTTAPFDAVAFGLFGAANNLDIKYFEFCSDR